MSIIFPEGITFELRYLSIYDNNPDVIPSNLTGAFGYQVRTVFDSNVDTSNVKDVSYLFNECKLLCRFNEMDFSNVNSMNCAFYNCKSLVSIPQLNTSNVTNFNQCFNGCSSLKSIPQLDTSNSTSFNFCFGGCSSLKSIPQLNTSKAQSVSYMFSSCSSLRSIPLLDFGKVTDVSNMFGWGSINSLTDLGGFKNLKINFTDGLNHLPNLTVQSLMNVINNLYDFRANGDSTTTKTLQLGTTNLNKLTDEQKAVATNKGWSLT